MSNTRNIWYWEGANCLADIAVNGVGRNSKISRKVPSLILNHCTQIIPCTDTAIENLDKYPIWE